MARRAHIVGKVEYREGDGPNIVVPQGPCEIVATAIDVTLAWAEGDTRGSAALPLADFRRMVLEGAIVLEGDAPPP